MAISPGWTSLRGAPTAWTMMLIQDALAAAEILSYVLRAVAEVAQVAEAGQSVGTAAGARLLRDGLYRE